MATNDPFDAPLINPNLLGTEFDLFTMREAIRSAKRFVSAPAWKDYIIAPVNGLENTDTDETLNAFIQGNSATVFHPFGSAAMSPKGASHGVVDPNLLVKGVSGLRVVDASILVSQVLRSFVFLLTSLISPSFLLHTQLSMFILSVRGRLTSSREHGVFRIPLLSFSQNSVDLN